MSRVGVEGEEAGVGVGEFLERVCILGRVRFASV